VTLPSGENLGVQLVIGEHGRNFIADVFLDGVEGVDKILACQREGLALGPDSGCAADAMDVIFRVLGKIEVNDMGDAVDVKPTAGNVGGHKNWQFAVLELIEHFQAPYLLHVSRQAPSTKAVALQFLDEAFGADSGVDENHGSGRTLPPEEAQ